MVLACLDVVLRVIEEEAESRSTAEEDEGRVEVIFAVRVDEDRRTHDGPARSEAPSTAGVAAIAPQLLCDLDCAGDPDDGLRGAPTDVVVERARVVIVYPPAVARNDPRRSRQRPPPAGQRRDRQHQQPGERSGAGLSHLSQERHHDRPHEEMPPSKTRDPFIPTPSMTSSS